MTCFNIGVEITGSPAMRAVALSRADCSQAMQVRLRRLALDMSKHSTNPKNKGANLGNAIKPKSEVLRDAGMRRNHRTECSTPSSIMKVWRDRRELRNLMKGSGGLRWGPSPSWLSQPWLSSCRIWHTVKHFDGIAAIRMATPSGVSADNFALEFALDTVTRKAVIIGNAGMSDVEAVGGSQGITFQEKLGSGAVQTTTIAKDGSSVHSRHTLIGGKVTPSQYYGSCPYEHRSRDVENSVVAAIPVAIVGGVASHLEAFKEQDRVIKSWTEDTRIWKGLRCGSQFLGKDMTAYTNEFGLIDIGGAGCSDGKFLTRVDEIREAMNQPAPALPENSYWAIYFPTMGIWLVFALIAFGVVNLLGLWFLAVRSATRWIKAEFQ